MGILDRFVEAPVDPPAQVDQQPPGILGRFVTEPQDQLQQERVPETLGHEFVAGVHSGTDQLQASLFGLSRLVGRELGIQSLEQASQEGLDRNMAEALEFTPSVAGFTEVENMEDFFKWMAGGLGNAVPSLGLAVASGGIGGIIGRKAVERGIRDTIRQRMVTNMTSRGIALDQAERAANRTLRSHAGFTMLRDGMTRGRANTALTQQGFKRGAQVGVTLGSGGPQTGETDIALQEAGIDAGFSSILAGTAGGLLEIIPAVRLIEKGFPNVDKMFASNFIQDFAKFMGVQSVLEGSTESMQDVIQMAALAYHDPTFDLTDPANIDSVINSFAAGALVGAASGGAAVVTGRATTAARRSLYKDVPKPRLDEVEVEPVEADDVASEDFEPANNTVFEEVQRRVNGVMQETVGPAMNTIRTSFKEGVDRTSEAVPALNEVMERMSGRVRQVHDEFVEGHKPIVDDARRYAKESIAWISEQAAQITDPQQRATFIKEQMAEVQEQFASVAEDLRGRANRILKRTESEVDSIGVFDDDFGTSQTNPETDFVFGANESFTNEQGVKVTRRTRGERAQPFTTEKAARDAVPSVAQRFPNIPESAFDVRETEGGFVVTIDDSGQRDTLVEDDQVSEAVDNARTSARGNPDRTRQAQVQMQGVTGKTFLDIPTLIFASRKLGTSQDGTVEQSFHNLLAHMLDRNIIGDDGFQALNDAFLERYPNKFRKAKMREQLEFENSELGRELREGRRNFESLIDDDNQAVGEQGDEIKFFEDGQGRTLESDADQARRQSSASTARPKRKPKPTTKPKPKPKPQAKAKPKPKPKPKPKKPQRQPPVRSKSKSKVEVFLRNPDGSRMDGVLRESIRQVAERVSNLLSDGTKIHIINRPAALEMIAKKHPHADIARQMLNRGKFAAKYDANGPTYILVDDFTDAGVSMASLLHELGHVIQYDTWEQLSQVEQDKLWDAFVADVESGSRTSGQRVNRGANSQKLDPAEINVYEFREWMADNFVDWMANRTQPKTAIEKFMETVAQKMDQFWEFIQANPGRFNRLNETYADFADALARKIAGQDVTGRSEFFQNEGAAGRPVETLYQNEGDIVAPEGVTERAWRGVQERTTEMYPQIAAKGRAIADWFASAYKLVGAPSTSVMRDIGKRGIKSADFLANLFNRAEHGKPKLVRNYHQRSGFEKGRFLNRRRAIFKGMTEPQKAALIKRLRAMDGDPDAKPKSLRERQIRKLFDDIHDYMLEAGLPVGKIPNYFPRSFSRDKLIEGEETIVTHVAKEHKKRHPNSTDFEADQAGRKFFNALISQEADAAAAQAEVQNDELSMQSPSFQAINSRIAKSDFMDQYLDDNIDGIMANYITAAVKKAEFNRALGSKAPEGKIGGSALPKSVWNSRGKLEQLLADARKEGATKEELKLMKDYVDANLGMLGRDSLSPGVRTAMSSIIAYQNMRTLLFTVFASLPDMVGPAIRSGNMRQSFKVLFDNINDARTSDNDLAEMARTWGIISDTANQHVLTEYVDNHYMAPGIRKWNDKFFTYTGLNWYTDFTRKAALAVGIDSIKNEAAKTTDATLTQKERDRAKQFLKELGLNAKDVDQWVADGERTWGGIGYEADSTTDRKVAEALIQFVDESIMRPNASQRPILASHPAAMLIFHLKGYIYAIHDTILKRLVHNFRIADTEAQIVSAIAPAIMMMLLTAVGLELRELVTGNRRTDKQDGWDYTWNVVERSGLLGIAQLGWDFTGADARGQAELAALGGPTISQFADLISKPASQTIPKAIPVVSQLPWARDMLRNSTRPGPGESPTRTPAQGKIPSRTLTYERSADVDTQARQIAGQLLQLKRDNPEYKVQFNQDRLGLNNALLGRAQWYYNNSRLRE